MCHFFLLLVSLGNVQPSEGLRRRCIDDVGQFIPYSVHSAFLFIQIPFYNRHFQDSYWVDFFIMGIIVHTPRWLPRGGLDHCWL